jgi:hypothetical protein
VSLTGELTWYEDYAAASPKDQRRALYGRCMFDVTKFIQDHASEHDDPYALMDAAQGEFRALLEATLGLLLNSVEPTG